MAKIIQFLGQHFKFILAICYTSAVCLMAVVFLIRLILPVNTIADTFIILPF